MKVKNIGTVITGKTPATSNDRYYSSDDYMFVTPDDILDDTYIINRTKRYISCVGLESIRTNSVNGISIAVTCIGEIGRCAILNGTCTTNQQINSITDINTNLVNPIALYYWFKLCGKQLINYASQTVMPIVSKSTFENIELELPDINHQNALADLLSHIDNLIINNSRLNNLCKDFVRMIYDYWFVQFDFPDENGRPYKSSGGKMVYNDQLKQEIPEGRKVSDLANTNLATVIKPGINNFIGKKTYLATGDVNGNSISDKAKSITYINRESRANMQPTYNSVWFAKMKDSVKHIVITDKSSDLVDQCILSTGFCGLQANDTTVCYLAAYISQPQFEQTKDMLAHGATQKAISNSDLINIAILEPDDATLQKFANIVYPMLELMGNCRQMSKRLASLRDWLLPMLMNGQVEIRERKEASNDQV